MERVEDERLLAEDAAQVHHAHVEAVVAITEVAQVDEIALVTHEDGVAELQVAMDGHIRVGRI